MASEGMNLVPPQGMENGLNSQMVFQDEALRFSGRKTREVSGFVDEKMFPVERERFFRSVPGADFRRSIFDSSPGRQEQPENRNWNNGDGSTGTPSGDGSEGEEEDEDDDEDDDEDEVDEGDGEVEGLVAADDGNKKNNNSSTNVHSSSEKLRNEKVNLQKHDSSFGSGGGVLLKESNVVQSEQQQQQHQQGRVNHFENAITLTEPDMYYSQFLQGSDGSILAHKELGGNNGCGFSGRKDASLSSESGESLRAIFSDPLTGALMGDAMILPCGHSFGSGGMQHVLRMKTCCTCSQPVSEDSVSANLSLRSAVQAFIREEELPSYRSSKRRRDRVEQDKCNYGDPFPVDNSRGRGVQFPFAVTDRVIIKGNKRTPQRFVGREAVVTTQCLNGWYVVKTLDNAESVKLQYRSLAKVSDDPPSLNTIASKITPNWL